ncbi:PaaI family thioesterase [Deinococcus irradiatisoli]|uniref:PaaI family thioesterase n=1 Tax=Deinococcus irradiatisoli TaxID=2202254 RepID=A0A2Z3JBA6_9DEIO|nr:PaaI family thioesterase [Deinococcus irradiatisoli]AWN22433.1 PaaI family thioesterase [Deinococcus irradiatisoli]
MSGPRSSGAGLESEGARQLVARGIEGSAYSKWMGVRLRSFAEGRVEIELDLRPELTQHHGQAHGAVIGYLADTVSAWAASTVAGDVVTAEYKLNFLAPARGQTLWSRGEVVRAGKRQVVVRADVYAVSGGQDLHVATALATIAPVGERSNDAQR